MTTIELLIQLKARNVTVEAEGSRLKIDAPKGAVTAELREALVSHKAEILSLLARPHSEALHYALRDRAVLGVPQLEPCLAACGRQLRFYYHEGTGYGYCPQCDIAQRIKTRPV